MQLQFDIPIKTIFNQKKPEISIELQFLIAQGRKNEEEYKTPAKKNPA